MTEPTIRLMHYDPRWRQEFKQTRSSILQCCEGWVSAVEHIGSTAIGGLIARPTIDVLAGVNIESCDAHEDPITEAAKLIEGLNFRRESSPAWAPTATVLVKPRSGQETHRVFLMQSGSPLWNQALRIRDHLRSNPEVAVRFEETKVARWRSGDGDPQKYRRDKAVFLTHLVDQLGK